MLCFVSSFSVLLKNILEMFHDLKDCGVNRIFNV